MVSRNYTFLLTSLFRDCSVIGDSIVKNIRTTVYILYKFA